MNQILRFKILERDNFKCYYCGAEAPDVKLEVDHLLSVEKGGGDNEENLVASCYKCNRGKKGYLIKKVKERDIEALKKNYKKRTTLVRIDRTTRDILKLEAYKKGITLTQLLRLKLKNL